ncbi:MAG TPA: hypothetical protein VIK39_07675 [Candidatus Angelobacter sp.]
MNTKKLQPRGGEKKARRSGSNESSYVSGIDDRGSLAGKVSAMVLSNIFLSHVVLIMFVYELILRITDKIISLRPSIYFLWSLKYGEVAGDNPWHATGLEWQTTSPPPTHNFHETPVVDFHLS